jgi:hypothetical protein
METEKDKRKKRRNEHLSHDQCVTRAYIITWRINDARVERQGANAPK